MSKYNIELKNSTIKITVQNKGLTYKEVIDSIKYNKVDTFIFNDFSIYLKFYKIVFNKVIFEINKSLPYKIIQLLLKSNIKEVNCYFIPSDYIELFKNKGIIIKLNNDFKFDISFIKNNNLSYLKDIYYIKQIRFFTEKEVYNNLEYLLNINTKLRCIKVYYYNKEVLNYIISKIDNRNIDIYIVKNGINEEVILSNIKDLKELNKDFKNDNREIKVIDTEVFYNNNKLKSYTKALIKICLIIIIYMGIVIMFSSYYHEYVGYLNQRLLENEIVDNNIEIDVIEDTDVVEDIVTTEEIIEEAYTPYESYDGVPRLLNNLLNINNDVVGWLKVNNTKINYPILQTTDNSYYLNHDIYKSNIITGWPFMDYRNNSKELDSNTIIYGHAASSGLMFGELWHSLYSYWYTNEENQIITFNTLDKEMKWKVFSVYKIDKTSDYLTTNFYNKDEYISFIQMLKDRSIYDFNVVVNSSDKILTLSTCGDKGTRRVVVHAVLIKEEE